MSYSHAEFIVPHFFSNWHFENWSSKFRGFTVLRYVVRTLTVLRVHFSLQPSRRGIEALQHSRIHLMARQVIHHVYYFSSAEEVFKLYRCGSLSAKINH